MENYPIHNGPEKQDRDKVSEVARSLLEEEKHPMGGDIYIPYFCRATVEELYQPSELREAMEEAIWIRRRRGSLFPAVYAHRRLLRSVQKQAIRKYPDRYPQHFGNQKMWTNFYRDPNGIDYYELMADLSLHNIQSNIPERYKAFTLASHFFKDALGTNQVILEPGCSAMKGPKKIVLAHDFPFKPTSVGRPPDAKIWGDEFNAELENEELIDFLLREEAPVEQAVGFDIFPIREDDPDARLRELSDSFYPSELLSAARRQEHRDLSSAKSPKISYTSNTSIDVRDSESLANISQELPAGKADLIIFSNILYMMTQEDIAVAFKNLEAYCHEETRFLISEFAQASPTSPNGLKFYNQSQWFKPYRYRTLVYQPSQPQHPPQELFRWLNGRCEEVWLSDLAQDYLEGAST